MKRRNSEGEGVARLAVLMMALFFLPAIYIAAALQVSTSPTNVVLQQTSFQELLADGWHTTSQEATKLEAQLTTDPENLVVRTRLISYYTQFIIPEPRAKHVLWLIENHPDADIFRWGGILTTIESDYAGLNTSETIDRGRTLWLRQVERFSSNTKVLANAAMAFLSHDSAISLDLVRRARQAEPSNLEWLNWLGAIYARAVRASNAGGQIRSMTSQSNDRNARLGFSLALAESEALKAELETSTDVELLRATGQALVYETQLLATFPVAGIAAGVDEYAASGAFGESLLRRAGELGAK